MADLLNSKFQKSADDDLVRAFVIALSAHILFFSLTIFHMPALQTERRTEVTFLGAILDSFEIEKISTGKAVASDVSSILKRPDQRAGRSATEAGKPNFTERVNLQPKKFLKSPPQIDSYKETVIPSSIPEKIPSLEASPQPYQRLRIYR